VLVKELQSLGLSVEALGEDDTLQRFGKEEDRTRPGRLGMGLLTWSPDSRAPSQLPDN
jgi:hypothetical protein